VRTPIDKLRAKDLSPVLVGLGNTSFRVDLWFSCAEREVRSGGDLVLVGESAQDGLPADPVVCEVDRRWRAGLDLAGVNWPRVRCGLDLFRCAR